MNSFLDLKTEWLNSFAIEYIPKNYQIQIKHALDSDFGDFVGIDFETDKKSGYVHLWSSGMLGFGLVDMMTSLPIVDLEFIELNDSEVLMRLLPLIKAL